jgi:hypothetical protein
MPCEWEFTFDEYLRRSFLGILHNTQPLLGLGLDAEASVGKSC